MLMQWRSCGFSLTSAFYHATIFDIPSGSFVSVSFKLLLLIFDNIRVYSQYSRKIFYHSQTTHVWRFSFVTQITMPGYGKFSLTPSAITLVKDWIGLVLLYFVVPWTHSLCNAILMMMILMSRSSAKCQCHKDDGYFNALLLVSNTKNLWHTGCELDTCDARWNLIWNDFIPHLSRVTIYHIEVLLISVILHCIHTYMYHSCWWIDNTGARASTVMVWT